MKYFVTLFLPCLCFGPWVDTGYAQADQALSQRTVVGQNLAVNSKQNLSDLQAAFQARYTQQANPEFSESVLTREVGQSLEEQFLSEPTMDSLKKMLSSVNISEEQKNVLRNWNASPETSILTVRDFHEVMQELVRLTADKLDFAATLDRLLLSELTKLVPLEQESFLERMSTSPGSLESLLGELVRSIAGPEMESLAQEIVQRNQERRRNKPIVQDLPEVERKVANEVKQGLESNPKEEDILERLKFQSEILYGNHEKNFYEVLFISIPSIGLASIALVIASLLISSPVSISVLSVFGFYLVGGLLNLLINLGTGMFKVEDRLKYRAFGLGAVVSVIALAVLNASPFVMLMLAALLLAFASEFVGLLLKWLVQGEEREKQKQAQAFSERFPALVEVILKELGEEKEYRENEKNRKEQRKSQQSQLQEMDEIFRSGLNLASQEVEFQQKQAQLRLKTSETKVVSVTEQVMGEVQTNPQLDPALVSNIAEGRLLRSQESGQAVNAESLDFTDDGQIYLPEFSSEITDQMLGQLSEQIEQNESIRQSLNAAGLQGLYDQKLGFLQELNPAKQVAIHQSSDIAFLAQNTNDQAGKGWVLLRPKTLARSAIALVRVLAEEFAELYLNFPKAKTLLDHLKREHLSHAFALQGLSMSQLGQLYEDQKKLDAELDFEQEVLVDDMAALLELEPAELFKRDTLLRAKANSLSQQNMISKMMVSLFEQTLNDDLSEDAQFFREQLTELRTLEQILKDNIGTYQTIDLYKHAQQEADLLELMMDLYSFSTDSFMSKHGSLTVPELIQKNKDAKDEGVLAEIKTSSDPLVGRISENIQSALLVSLAA